MCAPVSMPGLEGGAEGRRKRFSLFDTTRAEG